MKRSGKLPDTPRIHGVRRRLARWRQTRPHPRAPIPAAVWAAAGWPRGHADRSVGRAALRVSQSARHRDQVFGLRLAGVLARAEAPLAGALSVVAHGRDGGGTP